MEKTQAKKPSQNSKSKFAPAGAQLFAKYFGENADGKRPLSVTIQKSPEAVFALLKDLNNFPLFLESLEKVTANGTSRAQWQFKGSPGKDPLIVPMGVEYDPAESGLLWKSEDGAGFSYAVAIYLEKAQSERGTIARMMVSYDNMLGHMAGAVEKIFGNDAELLSKKNLQRFKAFCETGHVPTIEGQSSGRDEDLIETKH